MYTFSIYYSSVFKSFTAKFNTFSIEYIQSWYYFSHRTHDHNFDPFNFWEQEVC